MSTPSDLPEPGDPSPGPAGVDSGVVPLPTCSIRAIRGAPSERTRWAAWLSQDPVTTATSTLKATDGVGVYSATVEGKDVVLKCWRLSTLTHRAYVALRSTRGSRQWRGAHRLATMGIGVPRSLALLRGRSGDDLIEVLVMERAPGRTLLEHMARPDLPVRAQHRLAEALARQCAAMVLAGVFNRDHKPSNLIVTRAEAGRAEIVVLDSVAIRPIAAGTRGVESAPIERLLLEAIGVGVAPRLALIARFMRTWIDLTCRPTPTDDSTASPPGIARSPDPRARRTRRDTWSRAAARIEAHGDPTPTDNPLSVAVR